MNQPKHSPKTRSDVVSVKDKVLDYEFSRRQLIVGGAVAGGIIAIGGGAYLFNNRQKDLGYTILKVSNSDIIKLENLELVEDASTFVKEGISVELPYNSLCFQDDDTLIATLQPTETGSPLTNATIIDINSGKEKTLLTKSISTEKGFEIYEFHATNAGAIWIESNILRNISRVYTTNNFQNITESARLVFESNEDWSMPSVAISNNFGYIQTTPTDTKKTGATAKILEVELGSTAAPKEIIESRQNFACNFSSYKDGIVAAPRSNAATSSYELIAYNTQKGEVEERITLPTSMKPQDIAYGTSGFSFTFSGTYDYGDGISSLGTYAPVAKNSSKWVNFERTPTCPPAWIGNNLVVKSTTTIAIIDAENGRYTTITPPDGADTYGLWLACTGEKTHFTTVTNVDITNVKGEKTHNCQVKVWHSA